MLDNGSQPTEAQTFIGLFLHLQEAQISSRDALKFRLQKWQVAELSSSTADDDASVLALVSEVIRYMAAESVWLA